MKKVMEINGMNCEHCATRVGKALNSIDGVKAKIDLKKKQAIISLSAPLEDAVLEKAVTDAGYEVVSTKEKKSIF
ncbi:MAG: cation transporter [Clostridia bacterium]|nr:cation transporter [Clostridia bacterium]